MVVHLVDVSENGSLESLCLDGLVVRLVGGQQPSDKSNKTRGLRTAEAWQRTGATAVSCRARLPSRARSLLRPLARRRSLRRETYHCRLPRRLPPLSAQRCYRDFAATRDTHRSGRGLVREDWT